MCTREDRMKAVSLYLYLKWGRNSAAVRRELGHPSEGALRLWVEEFEVTGLLHDRYSHREPRCSEEQKQAAAEHYLEHGGNLQGSIRALGTPAKAPSGNGLIRQCQIGRDYTPEGYLGPR